MNFYCDLLDFKITTMYGTDAAFIYKRITNAGYSFTGFADNGVSEALYLNDPDGNGVELYYYKPKKQWPQKADGTLEMYAKHLDIESLLSEL